MPSGQNQDDGSRNDGLITEVTSTSESTLSGSASHSSPCVRVTHREETQDARNTNFKDITEQLVFAYDRELHDGEQTAEYTRHENIDERAGKCDSSCCPRGECGDQDQDSDRVGDRLYFVRSFRVVSD